ncbi:MAG: hypothetical protein ACO33A_10580 [Hyphomonas sp.]
MFIFAPLMRKRVLSALEIVDNKTLEKTKVKLPERDASGADKQKVGNLEEEIA